MGHSVPAPENVAPHAAQVLMEGPALNAGPVRGRHPRGSTATSPYEPPAMGAADGAFVADSASGTAEHLME